MRTAQRSDTFFREAEQQVEIIMAPSLYDCGVQMSKMVERYAIRVVSMVADHVGADGDATLVVVFEEEPSPCLSST